MATTVADAPLKSVARVSSAGWYALFLVSSAQGLSLLDRQILSILAPSIRADLQIGDADSYVHGKKTYVITYTMENVTRYFADTGDDEFYWDINGLQWPTTFGEVSATVMSLPPSWPQALESIATRLAFAVPSTACA